MPTPWFAGGVPQEWRILRFPSTIALLTFSNLGKNQTKQRQQRRKWVPVDFRITEKTESFILIFYMENMCNIGKV
ncbi:hypothetical protein [Agrobacterium fabrum]|uniref:hypothetical protein n=1 Tax=Agrobacterium fabrum TaxID=1176649 RepID=UPI0014242A78|nr:hypothetical protein [Agrobacterium fabrum]